MNYIKQRHTQVLFICFFLCSMVFVAFPTIDIQVSSLFFENGFHLKGNWWERLLYKSVKPFLILTLLTITILWLVNKYTDKNIFKIDGRKTGFIVLVLVLGSGLVVNAIFKDNFGRARPANIIEFNGTQQFTPAFVISQECDRNCSFSSGHGSAAFFTLALALLFKNRRKAFAIAITYGCLVSLARIAAGGHFFSDNVTSFFVMAITTDALYYILYTRHKAKILE